MSNRKNNALEKKAGIGKIRSFFIDLMVFGLPLPNSYEPAEEEALQGTAAETGQPDPIDLTERLRKAERKRRCRAVALCACLLAVLLGIGA